MNITMKFPGLEDVVTKMEQLEERVALHVELEVRPHSCPRCQEKTRRIHDYRIQKIKHLKWFERLTSIFYKKRRRVIAIDEYKGDTREGKYQLIIANGETREPIDSLPNRKKDTIKQYLQQHGAAVKIVIMDMNHSFKAAVREALDKPVIIADRFHFCRYIYWALDGIRRRVQKNWNDYYRKKGKRMRYVFYKKSEKLTEEDRWYLKQYHGMDDELK